MSSRNHGVGNAGEFYVLAQLAQRGYIAAKTDDGQTLIDVICTDPQTLKSVNIQVKTTSERRSKDKYWMMSAKNERVFDSLWYVLVELGDCSDRPSFYVFHSSAVGPAIAADHQSWLAEPKRDGKPRQDSSMRTFYPSEDELNAAEDNWIALFA